MIGDWNKPINTALLAISISVISKWIKNENICILYWKKTLSSKCLQVWVSIV